MRVRPPCPLELGQRARLELAGGHPDEVLLHRGLLPGPAAATSPRQPHQAILYPQPADPGQRDTDNTGGWRRSAESAARADNHVASSARRWDTVLAQARGWCRGARAWGHQRDLVLGGTGTAAGKAGAR